MVKHKGSSAVSGEYEYFKLDKRWWFVIWFTMSIQGIILSIAYAMAAFMIRSLYPDERESTIGRLTGILAATFPSAAFLTQYGWGMLSDRIGRKPVLMVGVVFTALSTLLFGLSDSFAMAVSARVLGGLFSSTGVTMKSICAEAWDSTGQAKALGIMSLGWTMGSTLGPAFGGALSEPCQVFGPGFPLCGPQGLFRQRPYALGCIAASSLAFLSFLACLFVLPETHPRYRKHSAAYQLVGPDSAPDDHLNDERSSGDQELELAAVHGPGSRKSGHLASPLKALPSDWRASPKGPSSPQGTPSRLSWQGGERLTSSRLASSELGIESQLEAGIDAGRSSLDWAATRGPPRPRDSVQSLHSLESGPLPDGQQSEGHALISSPGRKQKRTNTSRVASNDTDAHLRHSDHLQSRDVHDRDHTHTGDSTGSGRWKSIEMQSQQQHGTGRHGSDSQERTAAAEVPRTVQQFLDNAATEAETCSVSDPSLAPLVMSSESPEALQDQGFTAHEQHHQADDNLPRLSAGGPHADTSAGGPHTDTGLHENQHVSANRPDASTSSQQDQELSSRKQEHSAAASESREDGAVFGGSSGSGSQGWDDSSAGQHHGSGSSSWWSNLWPFRQRQPRSTDEAEYTRLLNQRTSDGSGDGSQLQISDAKASKGKAGGAPIHGQQAGRDPETGEGADAQSQRSWFKQQKVLMALFLYFLIVFFANMLEELTPIYASAPVRQGGLGLPLNLLAWPLTAAGGVLVVFTLYGYPAFQARVGVLACCGVGIMLNIPAALVMPLPSLVLSIRWLFWVLVYGGSMLKAFAKLLALTPSTILINQTAPRSQIGAVNGAGNTLGSFSRAAGPALAGIIWGQMAELHFWGHQFVPFGVVGVAAGIGCCWLLFMQHIARRNA